MWVKVSKTQVTSLSHWRAQYTENHSPPPTVAQQGKPYRPLLFLHEGIGAQWWWLEGGNNTGC